MTLIMSLLPIGTQTRLDRSRDMNSLMQSRKLLCIRALGLPLRCRRCLCSNAHKNSAKDH